MTVRDLAHYLALPYTKIIRREDDGVFMAEIAELQGCTADGDTEEEAIQNLREVHALWLEEALAAGVSIPEPEGEQALPSGKWLQRVPRTLHAKVADLARREGVSVNQLVVSVLAEAVGTRRASLPQRRHEDALGVFGSLVSTGITDMAAELAAATTEVMKPFGAAVRAATWTSAATGSSLRFLLSGHEQRGTRPTPRKMVSGQVTELAVVSAGDRS